MRTVLLALLPATAFNLYLFGWPAILLFAVTVGACVAVEALCLALAGQPMKAALCDGSAMLTGWLLAMTLPPWAPWWIGVLGGLFAIVLGQAGLRRPRPEPVQPGDGGARRAAGFLPGAMTAWVAPHPLFSAGAPGLFDGLAITFGGQHARRGERAPPRSATSRPSCRAASTGDAVAGAACPT